MRHDTAGIAGSVSQFEYSVQIVDEIYTTGVGRQKCVYYLLRGGGGLRGAPGVETHNSRGHGRYKTDLGGAGFFRPGGLLLCGYEASASVLDEVIEQLLRFDAVEQPVDRLKSDTLVVQIHRFNHRVPGGMVDKLLGRQS